jgi:hypothetical protein
MLRVASRGAEAPGLRRRVGAAGCGRRCARGSRAERGERSGEEEREPRQVFCW